MIVVTITGIFMAILIYTLSFLYISNSGSANAQLPGCFCPWTFSLNIGLNMFPLDSFMSCLHSLLGYSTGEFQALQLIVLAAFGAVDLPRAPCMLVHFCFWLFHILMPYNIILYFRLLCFHVSNSALFSTEHFSTLILYKRSLDTFYFRVFWISSS